VRRGALPAFARLASEGGALVRYERPDEAPAAFWTTLATGVPSSKHGVAAVDSFRPAGMETALAVNGPFRWYWAHVEAPLGLATQRPLLSSRRDAFTFWELVGRGGAPIVAVDWWGTYPASATPGLVVAHGAYQLLVERASGAVAPTSRGAELAELRRRSAEEGEEPAVGVARAALPQAAAQRLAERALLPDRFYRMAFDTEARRSPQAAALYLPAVDLAADGWNGGEVAFTDLLGAELAAADRMLGALLDGDTFGTVLIVLDPGRRGGREGRAIVWRRAGCGAPGGAATTPTAASLPIVEPEALASGLFRAVGLPQSGELPAPPAVCTWPAPPVTLPGFGRRQSTPAADASDEYLQNLRSLGYV
jgi:hypothetical protein